MSQGFEKSQRSIRLGKTRRSGFTIVEVMVVMVIMGLITTVVASMFAKGSFALRHGEAHSSLQRAHRLLNERVTPYVASAFNTEQRSSHAILHPTSNAAPAPLHLLASPGPGGDSPMSVLRYLTTEDFLADTPGNTYMVDIPTSAMLANNLGDVGTFVYTIRQKVEEPNLRDRNVVLQKLDSDNNFVPFNYPTGEVMERTLFFNRESSNLENLTFHFPAPHLLIMEATMTTNIKSEGDRINPTQIFRTTFNLPSKGS